MHRDVAAIRSERGKGEALIEEEGQEVYAGEEVVQCNLDHSILDRSR